MSNENEDKQTSLVELWLVLYSLLINRNFQFLLA